MYGKEFAHEHLIGNLCGFEGHFDRFGMSCATHPDPFVGGIDSLPACIARYSVYYAWYGAKRGLNAPETTGGKSRLLHSGRCGSRTHLTLYFLSSFYRPSDTLCNLAGRDNVLLGGLDFRTRILHNGYIRLKYGLVAVVRLESSNSSYCSLRLDPCVSNLSVVVDKLRLPHRYVRAGSRS